MSLKKLRQRQVVRSLQLTFQLINSNGSTNDDNDNVNKQAGQEKFHALGPIYYREANGALLVYDVTSPDSLRKVRDWVKELNKMLGKDNIRLAIIGNKLDLLTQNDQKCPQNNVIIKEAMQFTNELMNAKHYLTSAKLNQGIGEAFISLSKRMIEQAKKSAKRDDRSSARLRKLKTISVADDGDRDRDESDNHSNLRFGSRGVDLNAANQKTGSCQCWK